MVCNSTSFSVAKSIGKVEENSKFKYSRQQILETFTSKSGLLYLRGRRDLFWRLDHILVECVKQKEGKNKNRQAEESRDDRRHAFVCVSQRWQANETNRKLKSQERKNQNYFVNQKAWPDKMKMEYLYVVFFRKKKSCVSLLLNVIICWTGFYRFFKCQNFMTGNLRSGKPVKIWFISDKWLEFQHDKRS